MKLKNIHLALREIRN